MLVQLILYIKTLRKHNSLLKIGMVHIVIIAQFALKPCEIFKIKIYYYYIL